MAVTKIDAYFIARDHLFRAGLHETLLAADFDDTLAVVMFTTFLSPKGESLAREHGRSVTIFWPDGRSALGKVNSDAALSVGETVEIRWTHVFPAAPLPRAVSDLFVTARFAA